jgi:hypothetical protein
MRIKIYRIIILIAFICGCQTWSLTLRKEYRLIEIENRVLWKIFKSKREEVTVKWRRLYKEDLHGLYSSPNIFQLIKSRRMIWAGHTMCTGERRGGYGY